MSFCNYALGLPKRPDYHLWGEDPNNFFIYVCSYCGKRIDIRKQNLMDARYGCPGNPFSQNRVNDTPSRCKRSHGC